jgi:hypothetical protein
MIVTAFKFDLEGFAEDAQGVVVGVERAVDDRCDQPFGIVIQQGLFQDAFAGAGFAEHQTEAALLGVDAEDVEDFLLVGQQREGFRVEGVALEAKMGTDHKLKFGCWWMERFSVIGDGVEQAGFTQAFFLDEE